jgi:choline-sulfatase
MTCTRKIAIGILAATLFAAGVRAAPKPNVLLIAIDDLNDWIGCLGGHPQAHTPNIDRLAARGVLFTNAHCQAPICNPSRTSFMTGLRPSTTGIYQNRPWFRGTPANRERVTLSQHFGANGYRTATTGKIYHGSRVDPKSFQTLGPRPGQMGKRDRRIQIELSGLWDFGPQAYPEEFFHDFADATWARERLQNPLSARTPRAPGDADKKTGPGPAKNPFFLAVGFYRPHVPFYAPKRLFDLQPTAATGLPTVLADDRDDLPAAATTLTANKTPPPHTWFVEKKQWRFAVQSYLLCVRFIDEQVGRLLEALDNGPHAKNTIVVLLSDHGFHLGEKQRWAKQSLWERSTRVPFIISMPGGLKGRRCVKPVELLSLYPTLIELCRLPKRDELEGVSLAPLLGDPNANWPHMAVTTYQRNNHAVRSERWRYIRYADGSEELYDHEADPREWRNVAADPVHAGVIETLRERIPRVNVPDTATTAPKKKPRRRKKPPK